MRSIAGAVIVAAAFAMPIGQTQGQAQRADLILTGGKVVTVDDRFTIAQAVAVLGDRIVAVGRDADVEALAGPSTRRIDLRGRTLIPGLIDNHLHLMRFGTTWQREVRWDGVGSRRQALDLLRARVKTTPVGEWIYTLGGWALGQFADDSQPFTRDELDRVAPDHPVLLQASYYQSYLNSRAMKELGVSGTTGIVDESGLRAVAARLPVASGAQLESSTRGMLKDLNASGLTAVGSAGCEPDVLPLYRQWAAAGQFSMRVFCIVQTTALTRGDSALGDIAYGESVYQPLHDPMFVPSSAPTPPQLIEWRRIATDVAKARVPLHVHANLTTTLDAFLDQIEAIDKDYPIAPLRWTLAHVNQLNASHLARMKKLGMQAAVHPWAIINGGINRTVYGNVDMPPLRTIQDSGIVWGLGSDGSRANQVRPFTTLWFAVTGKMVGGTVVLRQTISREDALIAHTRRNASLVFQEKNLGSIETGKLADLVVLNRDYLTVPADQIKDISPAMTIVGGRIVFDAAAAGR
jgi:predicted amidohydrolase YtcJ